MAKDGKRAQSRQLSKGQQGTNLGAEMGPGAESFDFPGVDGIEGTAPNGSPMTRA